MNGPHPRILILGYSEASMFLKSNTDHGLTGLVSIGGQRDPHFDASIEPRLDLAFDDTPSIDGGDEIGQYRIREQQRKAAEIGLHLQPPSIEDAEAIIDFAAQFGDVRDTVMFQCFAGISRSAGAALLALAQWYGPGQEQHAVRELFRARPAAQPHTGLVDYGDQRLKRDGRLMEALRIVQRSRM